MWLGPPPCVLGSTLGFRISRTLLIQESQADHGSTLRGQRSCSGTLWLLQAVQGLLCEHLWPGPRLQEGCPPCGALDDHQHKCRGGGGSSPPYLRTHHHVVRSAPGTTSGTTQRASKCSVRTPRARTALTFSGCLKEQKTFCQGSKCCDPSPGGCLSSATQCKPSSPLGGCRPTSLRHYISDAHPCFGVPTLNCDPPN